MTDLQLPNFWSLDYFRGLEKVMSEFMESDWKYEKDIKGIVSMECGQVRKYLATQVKASNRLEH
jgi:hypothetical protein